MREKEPNKEEGTTEYTENTEKKRRESSMELLVQEDPCSAPKVRQHFWGGALA